MANLEFDGRIFNDENGHDMPLRTKQITNEVRSIKKQVFGELKNVMHRNQQLGLTPVKGNAARIDGLPGKFGASSSLCNDLLRKQHFKQNLLDAHQFDAKYHTKIATESYKELVYDEDIFNSWDFDRKCCQEQKSEEDIWAELDLQRLNIGGAIHRCSDDENDLIMHGNDPIFEDFGDDLTPTSLPAFDSMTETDEQPLFEIPELADCFEEIMF